MYFALWSDFLQCGTIKSINLVSAGDHESATATIEFGSKDDVLAAQTKDMKMFDSNQIEVLIGSGSTLFVTNFPPTADEGFIRDMFVKVVCPKSERDKNTDCS